MLLLNDVCYEFRAQKNYIQTLEYAKEILVISNKLNYTKGKAFYYNHAGIVLYRQNKYDEAISDYEESLKYYKMANMPSGEAIINGNLGNAYYRKELFPKSIQYFLRALKYYESAGKKIEFAGYAGNIGAIYNSIGENKQALEFYFKALKVNEEIKNDQGMAINYVCIANSYNDQKRYEEANEYYQKALVLNLKKGDEEYIGNNYSNLGLVNINLKKYDIAKDYLFKAMEIQKKYNDGNSLVTTESVLGELYLVQEKYADAETILLSALTKAEKTNSLKLQREIHASLSTVYKITGKYNLSLEHYKKHIISRDSLQNISNQKDVMQKQLQFDYERKETIAKAAFEKEQSLKQIEIEKRKQAIVQLEKDNALKQLSLSQSDFKLKEKEAESDAQKKQMELLNKDKVIQESVAKQKNEELKKQTLLRNIFIGGAVLLLVFAFLILRSLKQSRNANAIIASQKLEVERQKHIVEEKQKEIVDSINYAQRIQYALLANKKMLDENLSDYFLLFQPKDVVSGDFYWGTKFSDDSFALVTADSTGHGVPGAIMSILNIACLNEAVNGDKLTEPAQILNATRSKIIKHLLNDGSNDGGKDGMDCSILKLNFKTQKLTYAAANNPVWIIRENKIMVLPADKMPVGKHDKDEISFVQAEVELNKGDVIYTFTDGYADQFGGENGKKFKYKQLQDVLLSINKEPMVKQHEVLKNAFNSWKGNLEQIDDVCLIGVRI